MRGICKRLLTILPIIVWGFWVALTPDLSIFAGWLGLGFAALLVFALSCVSDRKEKS